MEAAMRVLQPAGSEAASTHSVKNKRTYKLSDFVYSLFMKKRTCGR